MISNIADFIAGKLCASGSVQECDKGLYQYGIFMLLSWALFFVLTCVFGLLLRVPGESLLFYVTFSLLRSYAGGVHARTEKACTILTALTMVVCVMAIRLLEAFSMEALALFLLAVGVVFVFVLSPLDSVEKPLEPDERKHYKKITEVIAVLYVVAALLADYTEHSGVLSSISVSAFVEGMLLIIGKLLSVRHGIPVTHEAGI